MPQRITPTSVRTMLVKTEIVDGAAVGAAVGDVGAGFVPGISPGFVPGMSPAATETVSVRVKSVASASLFMVVVSCCNRLRKRGILSLATGTLTYDFNGDD